MFVKESSGTVVVSFRLGLGSLALGLALLVAFDAARAGKGAAHDEGEVATPETERTKSIKVKKK